MYYSNRLVPEILEIVNNAKTEEEQLKILNGYKFDTTFTSIMNLWLNEEFEDFSNVTYPTHTLPNGLAPQTISNNIGRITSLVKRSIQPKNVKDKMFSNILHSVNQNEIDFLIALTRNDVETLYPNVSKELIYKAYPYYDKREKIEDGESV